MTEQLLLDLPLKPALGRADFLVAPCNAEAVHLIERWPHWPGPGLVVTGEAGSGKTHLAHVWQARSHARVLSLPATLAWDAEEVLTGAAAFALDDCDTVVDEAAFLHLFNLAVERHVPLLLLARRPVGAWPLQRADLVSRLHGLPMVAIAPPDEVLLSAVTVKLFADRQKDVAPDVVAWLLTRIERSFAAVHDAVQRLDAAALAAHAPVTVGLARRVLAGERD